MKVLLGIGDSNESTLALERTIDRVRATGDDLTVAVYGRDADAREATAEEVRERLREAGVDAQVHPLDEDAGPALVRLAEERGFDRLVMPGGAESPLGKVTFDRTTEYVLLNCCTSVTLVR